MRLSIHFASRAGILMLVLALLASPAFILAQSSGLAPLTFIALPAPQKTGGMPLMQALNNRKTTRAFRDQPLGMQQLSNLLWAGFGINRPRSVMPQLGRTAPSARNVQDIQLYVVMAQGAYLYDAESNQLKAVATGDLRARAGTGAAAHAAVTIIFVAPKDDQFAQVDTGFIGQNIYLFAASEGLNAWFYVSRNPELAASLNLPTGHVPLYGQSVGFPEN